MANDIVMKVSLVDNSDLVLKALPEQIEQALIAVGAKAESYAKMEINRQKAIDTGRLINSITYAISGNAAATPAYSDNSGHGFSYSGVAPADKVQAVYIGTNVEYAVFVENGTSKMHARPYLKPAVADHVEEYKSLVKSALAG